MLQLLDDIVFFVGKWKLTCRVVSFPEESCRVVDAISNPQFCFSLFRPHRRFAQFATILLWCIVNNQNGLVIRSRNV